MDNPAQPEEIEDTGGGTETVSPETVGVGENEDLEETNEEFVPKGAMVFALVMLTGYAIWHEVVILRGGA